MSCICVALVCPLFICFPLFYFLSVDPETVVAPEYDYAADDQFPSAELPGKQPPIDHSDIAHSFLSIFLH